MDSNRLSEIEARLDAATPGPWEVRNHDCIWSPAKGEWVAEAFDSDGSVQLAAAAPTDLRDLLAEVRALTAERPRGGGQQTGHGGPDGPWFWRDRPKPGNIPGTFPCSECGKPTGELYMLRRDVWLSIMPGRNGEGHLHWICAEQRLGRNITTADLHDAECNEALRAILIRVSCAGCGRADGEMLPVADGATLCTGCDDECAADAQGEA